MSVCFVVEVSKVKAQLNVYLVHGKANRKKLVKDEMTKKMWCDDKGQTADSFIYEPVCGCVPLCVCLCVFACVYIEFSNSWCTTTHQYSCTTASQPRGQCTEIAGALAYTCGLRLDDVLLLLLLLLLLYNARWFVYVCCTANFRA